MRYLALGMMMAGNPNARMVGHASPQAMPFGPMTPVGNGGWLPEA